MTIFDVLDMVIDPGICGMIKLNGYVTVTITGQFGAFGPDAPPEGVQPAPEPGQEAIAVMLPGFVAPTDRLRT